MEKANVLSNTRHLTGSVIMTSPPTISESYDSSNYQAKPFFLKVNRDVETSGAFILNGIQCKIVEGNLTTDISVHENGKFYNNINTPIVDSGLVFIWDNKNKVWNDAATTATLIERNSEYRVSWLKLSKRLEKKFKYSKSESRKCFRTLKIYGVEELVRWLKFFKETTPSKDFVKTILDNAKSKKEISEYFDFPCTHFEATKEAMKHYIES